MKKMILLIEDNQAIRESAAELLALDGYEVLEATSGELALPMIETQKPDLIISLKFLVKWLWSEKPLV